MNRHLRLILVLALCAVGVALLITGIIADTGEVREKEVFAVNFTDNYTYTPEIKRLTEYIR